MISHPIFWFFVGHSLADMTHTELLSSYNYPELTLTGAVEDWGPHNFHPQSWLISSPIPVATLIFLLSCQFLKIYIILLPQNIFRKLCIENEY